MFGESGTSRTGEVHRYYKCATAKKHKGCKKMTVRKQWLEDLVVNQTMQLVKDDAAMESIIAKVMELQNKENTNIPLYKKQLRDAESGIQNMLNAIQAGILTSSTKERLEQLEETKRELEARIAEEKLAKPKVTEEFIRFWLLRFRKLDMSLKDQRQALVDTFINAIYLYDDKVLITFNYKEGTQTVTFGEAAEAASKGNGSDLDCFTAPDKKDPNLFSKEKVRIFCFRRRAPPHNKSIRSAWPGCFSSGAVRCGCLFFRPRPTHHCAALAVSGSAMSLKAGASADSGRPAVFHSSRAVWARFSGMATPSGSRAFSCCSDT